MTDDNATYVQSLLDIALTEGKPVRAKGRAG